MPLAPTPVFFSLVPTLFNIIFSFALLRSNSLLLSLLLTRLLHGLFVKLSHRRRHLFTHSLPWHAGQCSCFCCQSDLRIPHLLLRVRCFHRVVARVFFGVCQPLLRSDRNTAVDTIDHRHATLCSHPATAQWDRQWLDPNTVGRESDGAGSRRSSQELCWKFCCSEVLDWPLALREV